MRIIPKSKFDLKIFSGVLLIIGIAVFLSVRYLTDNQTSSISNAVKTPEKTKEVNPAVTEKYPKHTNITATIFWAGEGADESNDFIQNRSSFWMDDWASAYGGVDDPENRCDYNPCGFTPKENPFYFALPYADTNDGKVKPTSELEQIPWYTGSFPESGTLLKNRWIKIEKDGKTAYAQWEDVGPFGEDDLGYVFGTNDPKEERAGLDLSPATADYLAVDGRDEVSWHFIDETDVPDGPWKTTVTASPPKYN